MKKPRLLLFILVTLMSSSLKAQEYQSMELNGMEMSYRVFGEGEPLVFLHGFSQNGDTWGDIPDKFSEEYQVIIPDLRGHGKSTNPSGQFTHKQSALDVYALLDGLGIDTFSAMGISTGGMTLLHMSTSQPERVKAMILIGATSYYPEQARKIMLMYEPSKIPEGRLNQISHLHSRGAEQVRELMQQFYDFRNSYDDMNFTPPKLATVSARTLIIHGDRDDFFPLDIPLMEYESIPNSQLWVVPNGGHVPLLDDPKEAEFFNYITGRFLRSQ